MLADWFGFGCSVLEELRAGAPDADATRCQLWPEHFDLAIELGDADSGARAAYGASPGDAGHPDPYLYVSPWSEPPADPHWNDTVVPRREPAVRRRSPAIPSPPAPPRSSSSAPPGRSSPGAETPGPLGRR